jgi:hypothetical protein
VRVSLAAVLIAVAICSSAAADTASSPIARDFKSTIGIVHAADGTRDVIRCGVDTRRVIADHFDVVGRACERVAPP